MNSGYPWVPRHSPFPPPHLVFIQLGWLCVFPPANFFTRCRFFLSQAPAQVLAVDTLSLCPALPPAHSAGGFPPPGRAGAGSGGGRDSRRLDLLPEHFSLSFPPRRFLQPSGGDRNWREQTVRLQSPQMSHSLGCWSSLFAGNFKVTVANTLAVLWPARFGWGTPIWKTWAGTCVFPAWFLFANETLSGQ